LKILVTGASGFIGRWLVPALRQNSIVIPTDRLTFDVENPAQMRRVLLNREPDCVVHLAAATGRDLALDPTAVCNLNVSATGELARLCGEYGIGFAYTSSSEVYGDLEGRWCNEESPSGRLHNLYGLTKFQGEQIASLYCDPLILRLTMPYGPGFRGSSMYPGQGKAAIVNFLWAALHDQPIRVHRHSARSWVWIEDLVAGITSLVESQARGIYNVGRDNDSLSMFELARLAFHLVGSEERIEEVDPPSNVTPIKNISTAKLQATGWKPETTLEEGMEQTLQWLRTIA
jgi:nucleoside-diphosphate-sugar epimerase